MDAFASGAGHGPAVGVADCHLCNSQCGARSGALRQWTHTRLKAMALGPGQRRRQCGWHRYNADAFNIAFSNRDGGACAGWHLFRLEDSLARDFAK